MQYTLIASLKHVSGEGAPPRFPTPDAAKHEALEGGEEVRYVGEGKMLNSGSSEVVTTATTVKCEEFEAV